MKFAYNMNFLQSYPDYSPSLHRLLFSRFHWYHGCCFIPDWDELYRTSGKWRHGFPPQRFFARNGSTSGTFHVPILLFFCNRT